MGNQALLTQTIIAGQDAIALIGNLARDGFTFMGWSPELDLTSINDNRTFTAQWREIVISGGGWDDTATDSTTRHRQAPIPANIPTPVPNETVETPVVPEYLAPIRCPFIDVASNSWYCGYVTIVWQNSLFQGTDYRIFSPHINMTRAMFVQVLANMGGVNLSAYRMPRFNDVDTEAWYAPAIKWAARHEIIIGVGENNFAPNAPVTREQMAVMLMSFMQTKDMALPVVSEAVGFIDQSAVSSWAEEAVSFMQQTGIIIGRPGGIFDPQSTATRAEVAAIFARFLLLL